MLLTKLLSQPEIWENLENTLENSIKLRSKTQIGPNEMYWWQLRDVVDGLSG